MKKSHIDIFIEGAVENKKANEELMRSMYMDKILDFFKNINTWRRVAIIATVSLIFISTYYAFTEIQRRHELSMMSPWEYFNEQSIKDSDGLYQVINKSRSTVNADVVAVYMYQPKGLNFYRQLEVLSPKGELTDYVFSEQRTALYNMPRLLSELKSAGISIITLTSNHYDAKLLIAQKLEVGYMIPINVNGIDIGHILFAFKSKPNVIPLNEMKSTAERAKLKIY